MTTVRVIGTIPAKPNWTDRLGGHSWGNWNRLEKELRANPKWDSHQIDSLSWESLRVLRHLRDPEGTLPFQGRGLVVGYVQSGKTANYTAVAARAVDAGYRMVIVLSGIHDSLRSQTQNRLERELLGRSDGARSSTKHATEWVSLTSSTQDFVEQDVRILSSDASFFAVVKKNYAVLTKLDLWLRSAARYIVDMPVLLIDDEADQASINTKSNRVPDPMIADDEDVDEDQAPSKINSLIRSILSRAPKASYVAYTATPFANIFINPEAVDRRVGDDLFPKDFVVQLPRPAGYTGTEELFGAAAQGRDVLRSVSEDEVRSLRAPRRRKTAEVVTGDRVGSIPPSLASAVISFCLAGAIRYLRKEEAVSNTMLVHVSARTIDQERVARLIEDQLEVWREAERQGQQLESIFQEVWETFRGGVDISVDERTVVATALVVMRQIVVLVLNSVTGENLEYEEKPGRHIIAVGGNRLSRGLTLEGLTVSYFLRTASMCDTLLQMARWYGFRRGYEDLIRIWTTDGIASWFSELALVEQSMRDAIVALERAQRRPDEMAIRLRGHSDLLLTAKNKAATAVTQRDSWSGEHPQTVLLPLTDASRLQKNRGLLDVFIRNVAPPLQCYGGFLARDVEPEIICDFLRNYMINEDVLAFRNDLIADWIMERATVGELTDWSIFVASPQGGRAAVIGGYQVGLVKRRRISNESIGILIDPRHEGVDLPGGPDGYVRESGTYDADAMRSARPVTQGLLIVYPLDAANIGIDYTDAVIALALSLPKTSDIGASWTVNSKVANG